MVFLEMNEEYDFKKVEKEIRKYWEDNKILEKFRRRGKQKFYYLDGPPYTSGFIHIGTAFGRSLRDAYLRFKRMRGYKVWDRSGFDMHGMPTAKKVMSKLGLKTKEDILKYGLKKFIKECEEYSVEMMHNMIREFKEMGVVMDWEDPYMPIKDEFMEGVWWAIKKAWENKNLYEGQKVMTWCPVCGTALAKHELEYQEVREDSIYVRFPIVGEKNTYLLIWTTTPWTLPFNLGVMVNPDLDYVKLTDSEETIIVAKDLVDDIKNLKGKNYEISKSFKGKTLEGMKYIPPFPEVLPQNAEKILGKKIHTVLLSKEYVNTEEGTGLVHCAPGCGPEDHEVGKKYGIKPFNELDENGKFKKSMGVFFGWEAKKDDCKFVEVVDSKGLLYAIKKYSHDYAHCWRCHNPVVFRTTKQWFFKLENKKSEMRKANKKIKWMPEWAGKNQFDSWLSNLKDTCVTRQRFWGTPFPLWKCDKCGKIVVIGSKKELGKYCKLPKTLHLPWIDECTWKCECGGTFKRNPDVMDVWIDAGCVAWNCLNYPKEKNKFEKFYPPDFILEAKDQIRGWFSLLMFMNWVTGLSKKYELPYKSVYMTGWVHDKLGRKMSKSLGNQVRPKEIIEEIGNDGMRYYFNSVCLPGIDVNYSMEDTKAGFRNLLVLWNTHNYLLRYCKLYKINPSKLGLKKLELDTEEKFILSKLNSAIKKITEAYEDLRIHDAPKFIEDLYLNLSRYYIKTIRTKLTEGTKKQKETVLYVIFKVLLETIKMLSTITPFITEKIFLNFKKQFGLREESVQLFAWPTYDEELINPKLEEEVVISNEVVSALLNCRDKAGKGIRWPLKKAMILTDNENKELIKMYEKNIKELVNIKEIEFIESYPEGVSVSVKVNYANLSRFKQDIAEIVRRLITMDGKKIQKEILEKGKFELSLEKKKVSLVPDDLKFEIKVEKEIAYSNFSKGFVFLDTHMTQELINEGFAREVIRRIQDLRKENNLTRDKKGVVELGLTNSMRTMLENFFKTIEEKTNTLLRIVDFEDSKGYEHKIRDEKIKVRLLKIIE